MRADQFSKVVRKLAAGQFRELSDRLREQWRRRIERRVYNARRSRADYSVDLQTIFTGAAAHRFRGATEKIDFVALLRSHNDTEFMPGFAARGKYRTFVETTLPSERSRIIATAEQIVADRFPVFNLGFLSYGDPPRWNYDPVHKIAALESFYADINYLDPKVVGDSKIVWEISRLQWVYDLGQAYLLTGDEKYARKFFQLLHAWRLQNNDYHGVNYCSALESAFRLHSLAWGVWFFKNSSSLTNEHARDIYDLIQSCADFVRHHLSKYFAPNTHLFGEAYALFLAGTLFPELKDASEWQQIGHDILLTELDRQFTADGMHAELSTAYHGYAAEFLLSVVSLYQQRGAKLERRFRERLDQATRVLVTLQRPDGTWPHLGDEDGGRLFFLSRLPASDFRPLLEACHCFLGRGSSTPFVDSFWFCRELPRSPSVVEVAESTHLSDSGIITSVSAAALHSVLQCGKFGYCDSPHSHADMLHLDLSVGNDNFLVDPGTCVYTADLDKRNLYRGATAHNGPAIIGASIEDRSDPFGWLQQPDCQVDAYHRTATSEHYRASYSLRSNGGQVVVSRDILFLHDEFWLIRDILNCPSPIQTQTSFITPFAVECRKETVVLRGNDGNLAIIPCALKKQGTDVIVEPFEISDDYFSTRLGNRITFSRKIAGRTSALWILLPYQDEGELPESISMAGERDSLVVRLRRESSETLILCGKPQQTETKSDADLALLQFTAGVLQRAVMVQGSFVERNSDRAVSTKPAAQFADIIREGDKYRINATTPLELVKPTT